MKLAHAIKFFVHRSGDLVADVPLMDTRVVHAPLGSVSVGVSEIWSKLNLHVGYLPSFHLLTRLSSCHMAMGG